MASRSFSRTLRTPLARQLTSPVAQRRTFVAALSNARTTLPNASKAFVYAGLQQKRGVKTIDFAGHKEKVFGEPFLQCAQLQTKLTVL